MALHNRVDKRILKERILNDLTPRTTFSFYRYVAIEDPQLLRDKLYKQWSNWGALGRIYIAKEGINAQMNVPTYHYDSFLKELYSDIRFSQVPIKIAVEDNGKSFYKLTIKVRKKIVADGLDDHAFDTTNVGKHLNAEEFNAAMEMPGTLVVDMRNHYESEVGHFEGAITPDVDTFKDELPLVLDLLKGKENEKILMYCTGGVRCEKASAFLRHHGFKDVNQLYGGIIQYAREIKEHQLPSKYIGKNFVFDERRGERITNDVISVCHQCGEPCDDHTNCANQACHLLFIQCPKCRELMLNCCSEECKVVVQLPEEEQARLRKDGKAKPFTQAYQKGRLRPRIN